MESQFGKGSKFTFAIETVRVGPLVEPILSLDDAAEQTHEQITISTNVLVVDDRRDIRFLAQHFVEKAGGHVLTATNGQDAIDMIYGENPPPIDIIVMDMQMPIIVGNDHLALARDVAKVRNAASGNYVHGFVIFRSRRNSPAFCL